MTASRAINLGSTTVTFDKGETYETTLAAASAAEYTADAGTNKEIIVDGFSYSVTGVDLNKNKVDSINKGECPFDEVRLPELIKKVVSQGFLRASTSIPSSDTYLVAVPTPHKDSRCDKKVNKDK